MFRERPQCGRSETRPSEVAPRTGDVGRGNYSAHCLKFAPNESASGWRLGGMSCGSQTSGTTTATRSSRTDDQKNSPRPERGEGGRGGGDPKTPQPRATPNATTRTNTGPPKERKGEDARTGQGNRPDDAHPKSAGTRRGGQKNNAFVRIISAVAVPL